jgi:hypothetical protein
MKIDSSGGQISKENIINNLIFYNIDIVNAYYFALNAYIK